MSEHHLNKLKVVKVIGIVYDERDTWAVYIIGGPLRGRSCPRFISSYAVIIYTCGAGTLSKAL